MTPEEIDAYLHRPGQVMNVASIGKDGRPHLVAMWYGFVDGKAAFWTFEKAQKVINLRRDPRITCLVETGDTYAELMGVQIIGNARVTTDEADILACGRSLIPRYNGGEEPSEAALRAAGAKRAVVIIDVESYVSWDHHKLGGRY